MTETILSKVNLLPCFHAESCKYFYNLKVQLRVRVFRVIDWCLTPNQRYLQLFCSNVSAISQQTSVISQQWLSYFTAIIRLFHSNVSTISQQCFSYFIAMFQLFHSNVIFSYFIAMLQLFIAMLQIFQISVSAISQREQTNF